MTWAKICEFWALGVAIPQGSKDLVRTRRRDGRVVTRMIESSNKDARLKGWRDTIAWSARSHYRSPKGVPGAVVSGAVLLRLRFIIVKPKTSKLGELPTGKPDVSKLARAVEDALTGIVYEDDAQIVRLEATKDWGATPGVEITIMHWEGI